MKYILIANSYWLLWPLLVALGLSPKSAIFMAAILTAIALLMAWKHEFKATP